MQLFARTATYAGATNLDDVIAITERVNELIDHDTQCWRSLAGGPLGTTLWTTWFEGTADRIAAGERLADDEELLELSARLEEARTSDLVDITHAPVNLRPDLTQPGPGTVLAVIETEAAPGRIGDATRWALEACEFSEKVHGTPVTLYSVLAGPFSRLTFVTAFPDADAHDAALEELRAHPGYLQRVEEGGPLVRPGVSQSSTWLCVA